MAASRLADAVFGMRQAACRRRHVKPLSGRLPATSLGAIGSKSGAPGMSCSIAFDRAQRGLAAMCPPACEQAGNPSPRARRMSAHSRRARPAVNGRTRASSVQTCSACRPRRGAAGRPRVPAPAPPPPAAAPPPKRRPPAKAPLPGATRVGGRPASAALLVLIFRAVWRVIRGIWIGMARGFGAAARAVGSGARELKLEPAQRRDGLALAVLALALVIGSARSGGPPAVPPDASSPALLRTVVGSGAAWLPPLLVLLAWRLVRTLPDPANRGRLVVGWLAIALRRARHRAHRSRRARLRPTAPQAMRSAGGIIGYLGSSPLSSGLTVYVAAPLLGLLALFGVCVLTSHPGGPDPRPRHDAGRQAAAARRRIDEDARGRGRVGHRSDRRRAAVKRSRSRSRVGAFADDEKDTDNTEKRAKPGRTSRTTSRLTSRPASRVDWPTRPGARRQSRGRGAPASEGRRRSRRRAEEGRAAPDPVVGRLRAAAAGHAEGRQPRQGEDQGQRRRHRGADRRVQQLLRRRGRHRVLPRPDGHALRDRARPGRQGRAHQGAAPATSATRSRAPTSGSSTSSRARAPSASRSLTSTAKTSASATCCAAASPPSTRTRCWSASARTSRAGSWSPTCRRCRTSWWPVPPVPVSRPASTR